MTETATLRTCYARLYTAGIFTLLAVTIGSAAWTKAPSQPAMDVEAVHSSIDVSRLPVQWHVDAF